MAERTHLLAELQIRRGAVQGIGGVRRVGDESGGVVADGCREVARLEGCVPLCARCRRPEAIGFSRSSSDGVRGCVPCPFRSVP